MLTNVVSNKVKFLVQIRPQRVPNVMRYFTLELVLPTIQPSLAFLCSNIVS